MSLKQIFQLDRIPYVCSHNNLKRLLAKVCFDASLGVCLDLWHFVSLSTIYAVKRNVEVYIHAYISG